MLSYEKWKMLNESLGRTNLGLAQRPSLGLISNMHTQTGAETNEGWEDDELDRGEEDHGDKAVDLGDYHDEMKSSDEDMEDSDDMGDEDMEDSDDMGDEDMEDSDDMDDEDMEDSDDMDDEEDDEFSDEEDDEIDMHAEKMSDDHGDEEEVDDIEERPTHRMGMGENKKLPKGMLSESDWWASVKGMVGHVEPNGKIINEIGPIGMLTNRPEDQGDEYGDYPSSMKPIFNKYDDVLEKDLLDKVSKNKDLKILERFVEPLFKALLNKTSKNTIISHLKNMLEKAEKYDDNDQTDSAM
jgi:hypothetical protein